jgi:hypothetical protein
MNTLINNLYFVIIAVYFVSCEKSDNKYNEIKKSQLYMAHLEDQTQFINDYCKTREVIARINGEPFTWLPARPSFTKLSTYPLLQGKNSIVLQAITDQEMPLESNDFEINLQDNKILQNIPLDSSDDSLLMADFSISSKVRDSVIRRDRVTETDVQKCIDLSLEMVKMIRDGDRSGFERMFGVDSAKNISLLNSDYEILNSVGVAEDVFAYYGDSIILVIPKKSAGNDEFIGRSLLSARGSVDFSIREMCFLLGSDKLHFFSNGQWIEIYLYSK